MADLVRVVLLMFINDRSEVPFFLFASQLPHAFYVEIRGRSKARFEMSYARPFVYDSIATAVWLRVMFVIEEIKRGCLSCFVFLAGLWIETRRGGFDLVHLRHNWTEFHRSHSTQ
jgi:hypothetical protein